MKRLDKKVKAKKRTGKKAIRWTSKGENEE